jgi:hypothetical protein
MRLGLCERLRVGVRDNELAALEVLGNHVVDSIAAGPAHPNDDYARKSFSVTHLLTFVDLCH